MKGKSRSKTRILEKKGGRTCRHGGPKSREETPKEGIGGNNVAAPQ